MDFITVTNNKGKIPIIPSERENPLGARYQMALIQVKVETNYTKLSNLEEVGKDLARSAELLLKFFGSEIGCQTMIKRGEYYLAGEYNSQQLQDHLDKFIESYILCQKCNNPETVFETAGKKKVEKAALACAACGNRSKLDLNHKRATFLVRFLKSIKAK